MNTKHLTIGLISLSLVTSLAMANSHHKEKDDDILSQNLFHSSIQLSNKSSEIEEQNAAKIGISEVSQIVSHHIAGKQTRIILENIGGNLIYNTEVLVNNHITDVIVDAGNGAILATMSDGLDTKQKEADDESH